MGILYKEEHILFPVLLISSTRRMGADGYGCGGFPAVLIEPLPTEERSRKPGASDSHHFKDLTGTLNFEQLALIMRHLPIDITFVDEHNRVTYYNGQRTGFFPTPAVISRSVECHQKSVHVVKNHRIVSFGACRPSGVLDRIQKPLYLYRLLCFKR